MTNARLRLQQLPTQADQVLVVGHLLQLRAGSRDFRPVEVTQQLDTLNIPPPKNVADVLTRLQKAGDVLRHDSGRWSLTPVGEQKALAAGVAWSQLALDPSVGAPFAESQHDTIAPELAPRGLAGPITDFLTTHAFDSNAFGISRYPSSAEDPLHAAFDAAKTETSRFGLELHFASDRAVSEQLWPNVAASMWSCRFGVAIIEASDGALNANVLIEVGAMLMTGRRCVLLKDSSVGQMPTDLVGHIYKDVDLPDPESVRLAVADWCENDLQLGAI